MSDAAKVTQRRYFILSEAFIIFLPKLLMISITMFLLERFGQFANRPILSAPKKQSLIFNRNFFSSLFVAVDFFSLRCLFLFKVCVITVRCWSERERKKKRSDSNYYFFGIDSHQRKFRISPYYAQKHKSKVQNTVIKQRWSSISARWLYWSWMIVFWPSTKWGRH